MSSPKGRVVWSWMRLALAAGIGLLLAAAPERIASADDLETAEPVPVPAQAAPRRDPAPEPPTADEKRPWAGPYVGLHAGYNWNRYSNEVKAGAPAQTWDQDAGGLWGGLLIGWNFPLEHFVFGIEADAGFGFVDDTEQRPGLGGVEITNHGEHHFRVRAGLPLGRGLLFATGGLALSGIWVESTGSSTDKNRIFGGTVGAGFEFKVFESVTLRTEYLYGNYGKETFNLLGTQRIEIDVESHNARIGVSWYFCSSFDC